MPTRSYRDGRTAKLLLQKPNAAIYPSVNETTPLIFAACTMWLDGETDDGSGQFTAFHLGNLIRLHGGNVLFYLCANSADAYHMQSLDIIQTYNGVDANVSAFSTEKKPRHSCCHSEMDNRFDTRETATCSRRVLPHQT